MPLNELEKSIAMTLYNLGAIKFGAFELKLHEKNPDAPLSPIYLNLRTPENPKQGPLTQEIIKTVGIYFYGLASKNKLRFSSVAGIPNAGEPFAEAFSKAPTPNKQIPIVKLQKEESKSGRRISKVISGIKPMTEVLVIDDLITKADSKIEAIKAINASGMGVTNIIVLVDREQGGREQLKKNGYNLHSVFTLSELLNLYVKAGMLNNKKQKEILKYIKNN